MVRFDFDAAALITGMTMPAFVAVVIALVMMVDRVRSEQRKPYRNGIAPRMPAMSAMSFFGALNFALLGLLLGLAVWRLTAPPSPPTPADAARRACAASADVRSFWSASEAAARRPPLLWTFPGAGNTMMRLLLDHATGVYTGSVYGDPSLLPLLPGEGRCDRSVVAVKVHPTHVDSNDMVRAADDGGALRLNVTRKPQYLKCAGLRFDAAILIVRDPYRSIWAEYKRYVNWKEVVANKDSGGVSSSACRAALRGQDLHSGGLLRACFAPAHWRDQARKLARSWKHMWFHYEKFKRMKAGKRSTRVLQVAYEEVLKPDAREAALRRIVDFLRLPHAVSDATLRCAFALADDPRTHRAAQSDASQQYVTLQQAYANASLVCDMWKSFRRKASKAGYAPIGGVRCQE